MTTPVNATFNIHHILILESNFKRIESIDFSKKHQPVSDVKTGYVKVTEGVHVLLELSFKTTYEGETVPIIESYIKMSGYFTKSGESPQLDLDAFAKINAPSIMFPFLREQLASLTIKAGVNPILLPPVNFVEMAKQNESSSKK